METGKASLRVAAQRIGGCETETRTRKPLMTEDVCFKD